MKLEKQYIEHYYPIGYKNKKENDDMGITCKSVGKIKSVTRKLENVQLKEKQLQKEKKKSKNNKKQRNTIKKNNLFISLATDQTENYKSDTYTRNK